MLQRQDMPQQPTARHNTESTIKNEGHRSRNQVEAMRSRRAIEQSSMISTQSSSSLRAATQRKAAHNSLTPIATSISSREASPHSRLFRTTSDATPQKTKRWSKKFKLTGPFESDEDAYIDDDDAEYAMVRRKRGKSSSTRSSTVRLKEYQFLTSSLFLVGGCNAQRI